MQTLTLLNFNLFSIIIIFVSTILINSILIRVAYKFNLLDYPSSRKLHSKETPFTGGLVLIIFFIFFGNYFFFSDHLIKLIIFSSVSIGVLGFVDDKFTLSPILKISFLTAITLFVAFNNINIITLGNYHYLGNLYLGDYSIIFTVLCILFLTNAFNYNDGIDGLTIFTFLTSSSLLIFISDNGEINFLLMYINTILLILLLYNLSIFKLPKIFLGNTGSLLLGFFFSLVMIYLNRYQGVDALLIAWCVAYLVYEFLATNLYRLLKKKKLTQSGDDHMHYALLARFKSKTVTSIIINLINILLFLIGLLTLKINNLLSMLSFIFLFFLYFQIRYLLFFRIKK